MHGCFLSFCMNRHLSGCSGVWLGSRMLFDRAPVADADCLLNSLNRIRAQLCWWLWWLSNTHPPHLFLAQLTRHSYNFQLNITRAEQPDTHPPFPSVVWGRKSMPELTLIAVRWCWSTNAFMRSLWTRSSWCSAICNIHIHSETQAKEASVRNAENEPTKKNQC